MNKINRISNKGKIIIDYKINIDDISSVKFKNENLVVVDDLVYLKKLVNIALFSLLEEVKTTPKPGLVDLDNNGSHRDMNLDTFISSTVSLKKYFENIVDLIILKHNNNTTSTSTYTCTINNTGSFNDDIFFDEELKELGICAFNDMLLATNNVNTHKGAIFNLGLVFSSVIYIYIFKNKKINTVDSFDLLRDIISKNGSYYFNTLVNIDDINSNGAKVREKYKDNSIVIEVKNSYPLVFDSLLLFNSNLKFKELDFNTKNILVLLKFMSSIYDSNILSRGGMEGLNFIRSYSTILTDKYIKNDCFTINNDYIMQLNHDVKAFDIECINKNLSPGGSADLLILYIFIDSLMKY